MAEKRRRRGFAALDEATRKQIASIGGHTAHAKGVAHQYTAEEARLAGRKGGQAVSRDRAHMAAIGRKGGLVPRPRRKRPK
jgi:general stress protein YciG